MVQVHLSPTDQSPEDKAKKTPSGVLEEQWEAHLSRFTQGMTTQADVTPPDSPPTKTNLGKCKSSRKVKDNEIAHIYYDGNGILSAKFLDGSGPRFKRSVKRILEHVVTDESAKSCVPLKGALPMRRSARTRKTSITHEAPMIERRISPAKRRKTRGGPSPLYSSYLKMPAKVEKPPDDENLTINTVHLTGVQIGDTKAMEKFYWISFCSVQQLAWKKIVKAWVKLVHPQKSHSFPYNGTNPPEWWPKNCIHKEPDHLRKEDQFKLMMQILRNLFGNKRWEQSVNALRRTTRSILWDKREDQVGKVLEDMYQAREAELQFLNNEIDATTVIQLYIPDKPIKDLLPKLPRKKAALRKPRNPATVGGTELDITFAKNPYVPNTSSALLLAPSQKHALEGGTSMISGQNTLNSKYLSPPLNASCISPRRGAVDAALSFGSFSTDDTDFITPNMTPARIDYSSNYSSDNACDLDLQNRQAFDRHAVIKPMQQGYQVEPWEVYLDRPRTSDGCGWALNPMARKPMGFGFETAPASQDYNGTQGLMQLSDMDAVTRISTVSLKPGHPCKPPPLSLDIGSLCGPTFGIADPLNSLQTIPFDATYDLSSDAGCQKMQLDGKEYYGSTFSSMQA